MIAGFKFLAGGLEHDVFFKKRFGRVYKITKPPYFGAMWELTKYVQNLIWCNEIFDDDLRLEGVLPSNEGVSLVISQPYIHGTRPSEAQIAEWFELQDYHRLSKLIWENPDGRRIADAHEGNFILQQDGALIPIDLHVERYSKSLLL